MVRLILVPLLLGTLILGACAQGKSDIAQNFDLKAYIITVDNDSLEVNMAIPDIIEGEKVLTVFVNLDVDLDGEMDAIVPVYIRDDVDMTTLCEKVVMRHYITFKQKPSDYRQPLKWLGTKKVQYGTICSPGGSVEYHGN